MNRLAAAAILALLCVGCATTEKLIVDNRQNLVFGKGMVERDLRHNEDEGATFFTFQVINTLGDLVVLHCDVRATPNCADVSIGDIITFTATPRPGANQTVQSLEIH